MGLQESIGELFKRKNAVSESVQKSEEQTARLERKLKFELYEAATTALPEVARQRNGATRSTVPQADVSLTTPASHSNKSLLTDLPFQQQIKEFIGTSEEIASGTLVELKRGKEKLFFFLFPAASGLEIIHNKEGDYASQS